MDFYNNKYNNKRGKKRKKSIKINNLGGCVEKAQKTFCTLHDLLPISRPPHHINYPPLPPKSPIIFSFIKKLKN